MPEMYRLHIQEYAFTLDPAIVFHTIFKPQPYSIWLDGVLSRFSYMGDISGPHAYRLSYDVITDKTTIYQHNNVTTKDTDFFALIQQLLQLEHIPIDVPFDFIGGLVGYFGYELYAKTLKLPPIAHEHPTVQLLFLDRFVVFDNQANKYYAVAMSQNATQDLAVQWFNEIALKLATATIPKRETSRAIKCSFIANKSMYLKQIEQCFAYLRAGESYEICLTNKLVCEGAIDAWQYYRRLRKINLAPYASFSQWGYFAIASASIESFLHIDTAGCITSRPIKGTLPRGKTIAEDSALVERLVHDEMFSAEHVMIVDLLRNDLGQVCNLCSVHVPQLMQVETYPTLHQLVSTICGQLLPENTVVDAIKATFPPGSMTGTPKRRTVHCLQTIEKVARGIYSGALGYLSINGSAELAVVMRTAIITPQNLSIGTGGAITVLSSKEAEYEEMLLKTVALRHAATA